MLLLGYHFISFWFCSLNLRRPLPTGHHQLLSIRHTISLVTNLRCHKTVTQRPCFPNRKLQVHSVLKTQLNWISSVHSVVSDWLWPHGLQHSRLPSPSPTPGAWSNSCPSSQWCHPTISSSVGPFSSRLQSFPPSGSFLRISSLHQVAKVSELQLQHQSFQCVFRVDFL